MPNREQEQYQEGEESGGERMDWQSDGGEEEEESEDLAVVKKSSHHLSTKSVPSISPTQQVSAAK